MQNEIVEINSKEVVVKEFRGQRVVTFKDIDRVHERPDGTARRNFNINKNHFILGEDYFVRNSFEAKKSLVWQLRMVCILLRNRDISCW